MIDRQLFKAARKNKGLSQTDLAKASGVAQQLITQIETGRVLTSKSIYRLAETLGVPPGWLDADIPSLQHGMTVPVVGYVGAGSEAHYYDGGDNPNEEVPMPPFGNSRTVAVGIRGESLGSIFNRWLIFYDDVKAPITEDLLRKLCVVGLPDGRVLVKLVRRGSAPGLYHLESQTEGTIEDVPIDWAAEVKAIAPR